MENSGVVHMLRNNRVEDLCCMYNVLDRVQDGLTTLAECVSHHLREQGKALVQEDDSGKNAIAFVQVLQKAKIKKNVNLVRGIVNYLVLIFFFEGLYFQENFI